MELKDKTCVACHSWVPPLTLEQKQEFMKQLSPEWKLTHENTRLRREYVFKGFKKALALTVEAGRIAEEEKHHPEIHVGWGHCDIEVWTHNNNNLVENDFILAAKIEEAYQKIVAPKTAP